MDTRAAVISIIVENREMVETQNTISTLSGKIGNLPGISVKTAYSGVISHE